MSWPNEAVVTSGEEVTFKELRDSFIMLSVTDGDGWAFAPEVRISFDPVISIKSFLRKLPSNRKMY